MPRKINLNLKKFTKMYQQKNENGYIYSIKQIAEIFDMSVPCVNIYRKQLKIGRGKGKIK